MKPPASGAAHRAAFFFGAVGKYARYCPDSVLFMADHLLLTQLPIVAIVPRRVEAMVDAMEKVTASDAVRGALASASTAPHASHRMYEFLTNALLTSCAPRQRPAHKAEEEWGAVTAATPVL